MEILIVPWIFKEQVKIVEKISMWTKFMMLINLYSNVVEYEAIPCVYHGRWAYKLNLKKQTLNSLIGVDEKYVLSIQLYQEDAKRKLHVMRYYELTEFDYFLRGKKYLLVETDKYLKSDKFIEARL